MFGRQGASGGFAGMGAGNPPPVIVLSASTVAHTAGIGTTIGTLSVLHGAGAYTFTLTSNPGSLFSISGNLLQVAAALSAGSDPITVQATKTGSTLTHSFTITVT